MTQGFKILSSCVCSMCRCPLVHGPWSLVRAAERVIAVMRRFRLRRAVMRVHPKASRECCINGFSLLEVLAALAIFAGGMVAVIGLYAPVTRSVAAIAGAEAAASVAEAVRSRLAAMPYEAALPFIQDPALVWNHHAVPGQGQNAASGGTPLIVWMPGGEVVIGGMPAGSAHRNESSPPEAGGAQTAFEVDLIREASLSPVGLDPVAPYVAFVMRVRGPMSQSLAGKMTQPASGGAEALFFAGAISR